MRRRAVERIKMLTPAAEGHGLCPWMNASRLLSGDVAPLGREVGYHELCPWGEMLGDADLLAQGVGVRQHLEAAGCETGGVIRFSSDPRQEGFAHRGK